MKSELAAINFKYSGLTNGTLVTATTSTFSHYVGGQWKGRMKKGQQLLQEGLIQEGLMHEGLM